MANKSVSPWAVVKHLLRSSQLLSVANQSSLPYSKSYLRHALEVRTCIEINTPLAFAEYQSVCN
jgi:hypothetical protein